jgi:hypothetical protein
MVLVTRSLRRVSRQLVVGATYRLTFCRLRWAAGRWVRVIAVDRIPAQEGDIQ